MASISGASFTNTLLFGDDLPGSWNRFKMELLIKEFSCQAFF
jgi:hypothetical protein